MRETKPEKVKKAILDLLFFVSRVCSKYPKSRVWSPVETGLNVRKRQKNKIRKKGKRKRSRKKVKVRRNREEEVLFENR